MKTHNFHMDHPDFNIISNARYCDSSEEKCLPTLRGKTSEEDARKRIHHVY